MLNNLSDICYSALILLLTVLTGSVYSQDRNITITLSNISTPLDREIFGQYFYLNHSSTLHFSIKDIDDKDIYFIVFQVHSHLYNITLFNSTNDNPAPEKESVISGTNVGLFSRVDIANKIFNVRNDNKIKDLKVYVSVHGYRLNDPVPGSCNLEFPTPIAPYLKVTYNRDYVFVDAAPTCLVPVYTFYHVYLPESDFDEDSYFINIRNMMTLDKIQKYGYEIPGTSLWPTRRMLSAYPGIGQVFVVVVEIRNTSQYSVYVPSLTYACSPVDDDCEFLDDTMSMVLCACVFFIGLFICFFGHRFFKMEMFIFGLLTGCLVTFIVVSIIAEIDRSALLLASLLSGTFFGAIWWLLWWFFGIPILSVSLPNLHLGFLLAAIFYHSVPGGVELLVNDLNFWSLFIMIMLITFVTLMSVSFNPNISNILCCAVLGAYATIFSMSFWIGSNLVFIIINVIRRATVPKFNRAVMAPIFGRKELLTELLWLGLAAAGFLVQHYHGFNRPPFPPPPRNIMPEAVVYGTNDQRRRVRRGTQPRASLPSTNERTPLLA